MKHGRTDTHDSHPAAVYAHHGVGGWLSVVAVLLAVFGIVAVYWIKKCRSSYRKKRRVARRAQSAAELSPSAVATANKRVSFRTRSASTEQKDEEDTERTPLVTHKIDSLARMLFHRTIGGTKGGQSGSDSARHGGRYQYSALEVDSGNHERLELERKVREGALSVCQRYLSLTPRYEMLRHLNDIGSRFEKHWFVVKDVSVKTDRLLSLVPICAACPIQCNQDTRDIIIDLFQSLQHPYIYPVLDFEFTESDNALDENETHAVLVMPFNTEGSLKDLIYGSAWQDDWSHKYGRRSPGLPLSQIQRLGRQILEALLFLRERGFPPYGHLHSGNVILQNGVARLAGLENTLLGYTSRNHQVVWRRARTSPSQVDVICFGHVLFEMAAGYELNQPQPSPGHLQLDLDRCPQVVEVLELIFQYPEGRYPTVEELLMCDLFRNIDLREMRGTTGPRPHRLPHEVRVLLDEVRKPKRACASEPSSPMARDRRMTTDDIQRVFSSDDCSLSDDPCSVGGIQHRELLLHLVTPEDIVYLPLSPFPRTEMTIPESQHLDTQCLLAVR